MKKFLVLYMAPTEMMEQMMQSATPAQVKANMDAWMGWHDRHKASIAEMGAPLGRTKQVTASGVSDTRNDIGGYSIAQAESADDAARLFSGDHPHLQMGAGARIEIIEIMPIPGM